MEIIGNLIDGYQQLQWFADRLVSSRLTCKYRYHIILSCQKLAKSLSKLSFKYSSNLCIKDLFCLFNCILRQQSITRVCIAEILASLMLESSGPGGGASCVCVCVCSPTFNMPALDLKGCLEDSPKFRKRVHAHEETVQNFESSLKSLIKLARSQVNLSQGKLTPITTTTGHTLTVRTTHIAEYSIRQQELAQGFLNFGQSQDDPIVGEYSRAFCPDVYLVTKIIYSACIGKVWKINP